MGLDISLEYKLEMFGDENILKNEWAYDNGEVWVSIDDIGSFYQFDTHFNITHNLTKMASKCNLYEPLWRPYKLFNITEEDEDKATILAKDLTEPVSFGLIKLLRNEKELIKYNPDNGWGSYDSLVSFTTKYLQALTYFPNARVRISR